MKPYTCEEVVNITYKRPGSRHLTLTRERCGVKVNTKVLNDFKHFWNRYPLCEDCLEIRLTAFKTPSFNLDCINEYPEDEIYLGSIYSHPEGKTIWSRQTKPHNHIYHQDITDELRSFVGTDFDSFKGTPKYIMFCKNGSVVKRFKKDIIRVHFKTVLYKTPISDKAFRVVQNGRGSNSSGYVILID